MENNVHPKRTKRTERRYAVMISAKTHTRLKEYCALTGSRMKVVVDNVLGRVELPQWSRVRLEDEPKD